MSQVGSARKRKDGSIPVKGKDSSSTGIAAPRIDELDMLVEANRTKPAVEWDYRIALAIITLLAFITRFWGISHPNEVVFDEVHFGKVNLGIPCSHLQMPPANAVAQLVCLALSRANLFFRRPSSFRKATLCLDGLVCGI